MLQLFRSVFAFLLLMYVSVKVQGLIALNAKKGVRFSALCTVWTEFGFARIKWGLQPGRCIKIRPALQEQNFVDSSSFHLRCNDDETVVNNQQDSMTASMGWFFSLYTRTAGLQPLPHRRTVSSRFCSSCFLYCFCRCCHIQSGKDWSTWNVCASAIVPFPVSASDAG
jgi:hypothetical protein